MKWWPRQQARIAPNQIVGRLRMVVPMCFLIVAECGFDFYWSVSDSRPLSHSPDGSRGFDRVTCLAFASIEVLREWTVEVAGVVRGLERWKDPTQGPELSAAEPRPSVGRTSPMWVKAEC